MITEVKTLVIKLLAVVHPEKVTRRKKRKKTRMAIAKVFALNTNTIIVTLIHNSRKFKNIQEHFGKHGVTSVINWIHY